MSDATVLFIGIGINKNHSGKIIKFDNANDIGKIYDKESCFYRAAKEAERFELRKIYVLNIDTWEEIKIHSDEFNDYEFDYIIPLGLLLDDKYYDEYYCKNLYYSQMLLLLLNRTMSTLILTGKPSNLYEDLDSFLNEENERIKKVKIVYKNLRKENMIYVANNINGFDYANVVLAAALVRTDYAEYPDLNNKGTAYFDIDYSDVLNELVYFKNNKLTGITVENLVNFSENPIEKLVIVRRIMKYLKTHIPGEEEFFIGKTYSEYRRLEIKRILEEYLKSLKDWIIYDYKIIDIIPVVSEDGTVSIKMKYDVWPKFTIERYRLETVL